MATGGLEFASGIKYVRIAKVDANGIDNSLSLSSLSNLRIKYSDKTNPVNYPIVGITEYQDYYQYAVTTTSVTSSADNFKADWGLDLDKSSFTITMGGDGYDTITNWNVNTDNLSILNNTTGKIDIPISSNVVQNYRIAVTSSLVVIGSMRLVSDVRGVIAAGSYTSGFTAGKELTGKIIPYAGENLYVQVALYPGSGTGNIAHAEWTMTPSGSYSANNASPALTLFEPYLTSPFYGTDCDVLYGNVNITETSTLYMDIDYSDNAIQAVNQDQLIAGTATKAQLQDFNYYSNRSILPRYKGSKNTSDEYNEENGAIDVTQAYFAYFNYVGGTSPEWGNGLEDRSGVSLRFLIDKQGSIIKPINDSQGINLGIVRNNFTETKNATLAFDDTQAVSTAFSNLVGTHTIFKSGKTIAPICYSQTASIASGSSGGYTDTLVFVQGDQQQSSANDYRLLAYNQGDTIATTGKINYQNVVIQDGTYVDWTGDDTYSPTAGNNPGSEGVTLYFTATLKRVGGPVNKTVVIQWYKNGSAVGMGQYFNFNNPTYNNVSVSYTDASVLASDNYDVRITAISGPGVLELSTDSYVQVSQNPVPSIGNATSPFWNQSGVSSNQIKAAGLKAFYGQKQEDIENSGFFAITNDFEVQEGDEIRFEGTETQSYRVMSVSTAGGEVVLTLDREVTASDLDWFLIRRYVDDPANIILEVDKSAGGTAPGILKPQYLTRDVENNIDIILERLRTDQLI